MANFPHLIERAFGAAGPDGVQAVMKVAKRVHVKAGEVLLDEGRVAAGIFLIIAGKIECRAVRDNQQITIDTLSKGQWFGLSCLGQRPERIVICCVTRCDLIFLPLQQLQSVLTAFPEAQAAVLDILGQEVERTQRLITQRESDRRC